MHINAQLSNALNAPRKKEFLHLKTVQCVKCNKMLDPVATQLITTGTIGKCSSFQSAIVSSSVLPSACLICSSSEFDANAFLIKFLLMINFAAPIKLTVTKHLAVIKGPLS